MGPDGLFKTLLEAAGSRRNRYRIGRALLAAGSAAGLDAAVRKANAAPPTSEVWRDWAGFLDEWNQINIAISSDNEDPLSRILRKARMSENVDQTTRLNRNHHFFERHPAILDERRVFLRTPSKRFHVDILWHCVPFVTTMMEPQ